MTEAVHEEKAGGFKLKLLPDSDVECPVDEHDKAVRFVVLHGRYSNPYPALKTVEEVQEFERENAHDDAEWEIFSLWLFDHSTRTYQPSNDDQNPFGTGMYARFDSGRVGVIALKKSEWPGPREQRFVAAKNIAREYSSWANGDCYGYVIENAATGEEVDSSWGFVGYEYALEQARGALAAAGPAHFAGVSDEHRKVLDALMAPDMFLHGVSYDPTEQRYHYRDKVELYPPRSKVNDEAEWLLTVGEATEVGKFPGLLPAVQAFGEQIAKYKISTDLDSLR
jgi:hypothetical protein